MKKYLRGFLYSLPVQLLLLHIRRYQVLLLFWLILLGAVDGFVMKPFGAYSLFLVPEYLGDVNPLGCAITGIAFGVFVMSWNVATFILFARHLRFMATTSRPFLKYCINNAVIPVLFLIHYLYKAIGFGAEEELLSAGQIFVNGAGFFLGLLFCLLISFIYFFGADVTIVRSMKHLLTDSRKFKTKYDREEKYSAFLDRFVRVEWFFSTRFKLRKTRSVAHYPKAFLEMVFNRHHIAAVIAVVLSFLFLIILGFFLDNDIFKIPAAASIMIFFGLLMGGAAALTYWLQSWAMVIAIVVFFGFDMLMRYDVVDPRNKAYGLNYANTNERPQYNRDALLDLCTTEKTSRDKANMISVLNKWKKKQSSGKPLLYIISVSGGGNRSAYFTMNVLQRLDSLSNGELMKKTFLITGASGGMLGATYFRELYAGKMKGDKVDLQDSIYADNISKDLLNSLFSSFVTRDLLAPSQKFSVGDRTYIKDRAYDFEQQLSKNTAGILDKQLKDYISLESNAQIPLCIFNSTVTADGRKMMTCTQPLSFMMRQSYDSSTKKLAEPDAVDFCGFYQKQSPYDLRMLTALRMNATFPYVLPNVWLPTDPIIDVMDAGFRDNFGQETAIRFVKVFEDWLKDNCSGVVMIQVRDRVEGAWDNMFMENSLSQELTRPFTFLQHNWYKVQDVYREEVVSYGAGSINLPVKRIAFVYQPAQKNKAAALNFHLTKGEKQDIRSSLYSSNNKNGFNYFQRLNAQ